MWKPIKTAPSAGQILVTDDDPANFFGSDKRYACIELVTMPMTADGRVLPDTWKWWHPVPVPRFETTR